MHIGRFISSLVVLLTLGAFALATSTRNELKRQDDVEASVLEILTTLKADVTPIFNGFNAPNANTTALMVELLTDFNNAKEEIVQLKGPSRFVKRQTTNPIGALLGGLIEGIVVLLEGINAVAGLLELIGELDTTVTSLLIGVDDTIIGILDIVAELLGLNITTTLATLGMAQTAAALVS